MEFRGGRRCRRSVLCGSACAGHLLLGSAGGHAGLGRGVQERAARHWAWRNAHRQVGDVLVAGGGSRRMETGGRRTEAWALGRAGSRGDGDDAQVQGRAAGAAAAAGSA
jgi:hypothetical protein